jgi:hypothetical protein
MAEWGFGVAAGKCCTDTTIIYIGVFKKVGVLNGTSEYK